MSARPADKRKTAAPRAAASPELELAPPLRPHKTLFMVLLVIFMVWVGVLVGLYFKTVYPARHGGSATTRAS